MKWLKNREVFLLKEGRSLEIDTDKFRSLLEENCKMWPKYTGKAPLYRGVSMNPTYAYVNPKEHTRKSIEQQQIHIGFLSSDPSWSGFPKYEKSLIGGTTKETCSGYGNNIYEVIPYDNANITFCPDNNIWAPFNVSNEEGDWECGINLVTYFLEEVGIYIHEHNDWGHVQDMLSVKYGRTRNFMKRDDTQFDTSYNDFMYQVSQLIGDKHEYTPDEIIQTITDILSPKGKEFHNVKYDGEFYKNYIPFVMDEHGRGVQFWTDSECLMMRL